MKIDWKHVATTFGYRSLKAAYIKDVQDAGDTIAAGKYPMRKKEEFLRKFNWIISRAKQHAHKRGVTIDVVLDEWEEHRTYWWLSYYDQWNQRKLHSNSLKPRNIKVPMSSDKTPKRWPKWLKAANKRRLALENP